MTIDLLLDYGYRFLFIVLMILCIAAALYPRARTPGMPPRPRVSFDPKKQYDFRDDAPELMEMLKKRYKSKDSQRKLKNIFDHIYNYYENRCKKCTK